MRRSTEDGPTSDGWSRKLKREGSWDLNSVNYEEVEMWQFEAVEKKDGELLKGAMNDKFEACGQLATSLVHGNGTLHREEKLAELKCFEMKVERRPTNSSGMRINNVYKTSVEVKEKQKDLMGTMNHEGEMAVALCTRSWQEKSENRSIEIDMCPIQSFNVAEKSSLAAVNRFERCAGWLKWLAGIASKLLLNGLRWRLSRIPKQAQMLNIVWSHRLRSQELERVAIQLIRAVLSMNTTNHCVVALSIVWSKVGATGCWLAWLVSLGVVWLVSRLSLMAGKKSRVDKRKSSRCLKERRVQIRALLFLSCMWTSHGMQAGGEENFLQQMSQLAAAATNAASAAEHALTAMQAASSASSSSGVAGALQSGLTAVTIKRNPDPFDGSDPHGFTTWKFVFLSWLTFAEPKYQKLLERVEQLDHMPSMTEYSEEEQQFSSRLFAILTSYLKGRCLQLVRSGLEQRDGFHLWKELHREYLPSTRARSLALAQALAAYPAFSKDKTVLECVLSYEQLVQEFEKMSGSTYPQELKSATLIRCSESRLREHLQLTIKESTTYQEIREAVLSHEQASKTWSQESIMKSLNMKSTDAGGPAPMEIDRIEEKGKGKGKQKGKQKRKGWWQFPYGGRGGGQPKGKGRGFKGGKSKGKNKGKQYGKSKGKQKGKQGGKKGGGDVGQNQCRVCFGYGHWSRDCPQRVQQVTELNVQQ